MGTSRKQNNFRMGTLGRGNGNCAASTPFARQLLIGAAERDTTLNETKLTRAANHKSLYTLYSSASFGFGRS